MLNIFYKFLALYKKVVKNHELAKKTVQVPLFLKKVVPRLKPILSQKTLKNHPSTVFGALVVSHVR